MSRFADETGRSDTLVNETIGEVTTRRAPRLDVALPEGFELVEMQQPPLEQCSAFDPTDPPRSSVLLQSPASSRCSHLPGANIWHSHQPSDTGSFKAVLTHDTDGRVAQVMRPTRLSDVPSGSSFYDSTRNSPPRPMSTSSPARKQQSYQGPTISATSQDIQIGLNTRCSSFSGRTEPERGVDSFWDDSVSETYLTSNAERPAYCRRNLSNEKVPASLHPVEETDPWGFPSPLPEAHLSRGSGFHHYQDRRQEQVAPAASRDESGLSWIRPILRCGACTLAFLSLVLPLALLCVAVAIVLANGKPVTSKWVNMLGVAGVLSTAWLFILGIVVAQALISWMTVRAKRSQPKQRRRGEAVTQPFDRSHIEAIGLLLFLSLTIGPLGSMALRSVLSVGTTTLDTQVGVWYIDRTGPNELWSDNPNNTLSKISRLELIQSVGEQYARSLLLDIDSPISSGFTSFPTMAQTVLQSRDEPTAPQKLQGSSSSSTESTTSQIVLDMTTSYFEFICADWDVTIRNFEDFASPMSYSTSQTLGMSMSADAGQTQFPMGIVNIASLNKIVQDGILALDERWEYSSIQCSWTQLFYNVPVQCDWNNHTGLSNCVQTEDSQLLLSPDDAQSGTQLGDFSPSFVMSGNIPTTERIATATERYIRNGGPGQPGSLSLQSNGTGLLNLSATVSPDDFATRFGHLFNAWVALGYCPQCSREIVLGNGSAIPAALQKQYHRTTSTLTHPAPPHLVVNWHWEAVVFIIGVVLLAKGVAAVGCEYGCSVLSCCCAGRRRPKKPEIDIDSMRMLLSPANAAVTTDRYPIPRRPVSKMLPDTRSIRGRISARVSRVSSRVSGASFFLPIQGARLSQARSSASAEEPADRLSRLSSAEFFARRYSNIPQERWSAPRKRSVSENPKDRRSQGAASSRTASSRAGPPSNRYSMFSDKQLPPLPLPLQQSDGVEKPRDAEGDGDGDGDETDDGEAKILSVRYSHVPPFRYRAPQQQGGPQLPAPVPLTPEGPGLGSENSSWIYDEYMSNKL